MTPAEAITRIKLQLGNWSGRDIDDWIVDEMNSTFRRLESMPELPWFLFEDDQTLTTTATEETVDLPSDFLREEDEMFRTALFREDTDEEDTWQPIYKHDYSVLKSRYVGEGEPRWYDTLGDKMYLRYIPNDTYTLRLLYYKKAAEVTATGAANLWLTNKPELIVAETGVVIAGQYVKDYEAEKRFALRAAERMAALQLEITVRREANLNRERGENSGC